MFLPGQSHLRWSQFKNTSPEVMHKTIALPTITSGTVPTGAGVVNAAADEIEIIVCGRGGHGAYPHHDNDPVAILSHIVLGLPDLMRRTISPMQPNTLSIGHLQAGEQVANVLPSEARLLATLRTTSYADR